MKKVRITESQLKAIVKNIIKEETSQLMEMSRDDIVLQSILKLYDESSETTQKAIARMILSDYNRFLNPRGFRINDIFNPKETRVKIYKTLRDMDYQEISIVRKRLGIR